MADIAPLTPLRYDLSRLRGGMTAVVAPPYDVISSEERAALAARDPHNIVRLILPDGDGDAKYENAAELLGRWRAERVLVRDEEPGFYRYDQAFRPPGHASTSPLTTRRGFLALVRLAPFSDRVVLPHERTLSGPKEDRLKLFRATRANLSPGFMLYHDPKRALDAPLEVAEAVAEFSTSDGVRHSLSKVRAPDALRAIVEGLRPSTLLIADGHHRYETAVHYSREAGELRKPGEQTSSIARGARASHPFGEHLYFMAFLANGDDPNLVVFPTHRHVHSLPSFSFDDFTRRARAVFSVEELAVGAAPQIILERLRASGRTAPSIAASAADGRVVVLTLRGDVDLAEHPTLGAKPAALRRTDVAILHAGILEHLLGITPEAQVAKTNLWYPQDASASLAELRANGRGQVLFLMNATPVTQVREVAEAGDVMPQKSTFFYPKIVTGLAVHTLEPDRAVAQVGHG